MIILREKDFATTGRARELKAAKLMKENKGWTLEDAYKHIDYRDEQAKWLTQRRKNLYKNYDTVIEQSKALKPNDTEFAREVADDRLKSGLEKARKGVNLEVKSDKQDINKDIQKRQERAAERAALDAEEASRAARKQNISTSGTNQSVNTTQSTSTTPPQRQQNQSGMLSRIGKWANNNKKGLIIGTSAAAVTAAGVAGYRHYKKKKAEKEEKDKTFSKADYEGLSEKAQEELKKNRRKIAERLIQFRKEVNNDEDVKKKLTKKGISAQDAIDEFRKTVVKKDKKIARRDAAEKFRDDTILDWARNNPKQRTKRIKQALGVGAGLVAFQGGVKTYKTIKEANKKKEPLNVVVTVKKEDDKDNKKK